jgi:hypothetical protein
MWSSNHSSIDPHAISYLVLYKISTNKTESTAMLWTLLNLSSLHTSIMKIPSWKISVSQFNKWKVIGIILSKFNQVFLSAGVSPSPLQRRYEEGTGSWGLQDGVTTSQPTSDKWALVCVLYFCAVLVLGGILAAA